MKIQLKHPYDKLVSDLSNKTGLSPTQLTIRLMQELQHNISKTYAQQEQSQDSAATENNNNERQL